MKIMSYKTGPGRRVREKVHRVDEHFLGIGAGYARGALPRKTLKDLTLSLCFDGRTFIIRLEKHEAEHIIEFFERGYA